MSSNPDENSSVALHQGLDALQYWIFNFPQFEGVDPYGLEQLDDMEVVRKVVEVAEEILLCNESSDENRCVTSTSGAWSYIHSLLREMDLADDKANGETFESRSIQHGLLCAMLCHAVSNDCEKQSDYVARIVGMTDRPDVQHEIMRIIQENAGQGSGSSITSNDVDDNTGDYSVLMNESAMNLSAECGYGCDNEDVNDSTTDGKRGRGYDEAFGDNGCESELLQEKKRHHAGDDDDSYFQELAGNQCNTQKLEKELNELRSANMKLQQELNETRQKELDLSLKVDELESQHRVEMLRVETESLRTIKHHEDKHNSELSDLNTELETLRECKQSSVELKEEVTRLKDELDVVQFSKEKLAFAEEQLRKCREKIELMGDAQDALGREEKVHAASVEKCIILENELSLMKPLKRQLEEYKMRADDAEVALEECRDDLRRLKEKSSGLEGANMALKRGASLQQAETGDLQKRLQEEGGKGQRGTAVGLGMSELNPELMQELMTLRNEHARLKEFASKREVDEVQRLEESRDDAARLSNRYKEQFFRTKSELEDTQQLLCESEDREAKLNDDVADWAKRYSALDEEMKEERLKSHKAAIDAERNFQNLKKSLIEKGRQDLKDLEDKLAMKIDTERKQHKEKLDRVDAERNEIEKRLSQQLVELRDQSSATLRSSKEQAQKRIDEVELSKQAEIERVLKEKADELDALTNKGKGMFREAKKKASVIKQQLTEEYDAKLEALEEELEKVKSFQEDYEQKATAKIAKRDKQIQLLDARSREAAKVNRELEEKAKKAERSSKELTGDNDRLRRQLGSRFGAGGASQPQMEQLMSAYNSLREENRKLKESNPDNGFLTNTVQSDSDTMHAPKQATGAINKSALIQYREEFEEQISVLEDEKRDLIMRNSAAMTDVQKAEQRSWELEEELAKVRSELTATKLSMQRNERRTDFSAGLSASSKKRHASSVDLNKENATPNIHRRALPPSGAKPDFTPKVPDSRKKAATTVPTLMDYTSKDYKANTETQPECKQS